MAKPSRSSYSLLCVFLTIVALITLFFVALLSTLHGNTSRDTPYESHFREQILLETKLNNIKKAPTTVYSALINGSRNSDVPTMVLPGFSRDHSEFIFSSLIERSAKSPTKLHITTIMLSHYYLRMPELKMRNIRPEYRDMWQMATKQFVNTRYYPSGRRRYSAEERFSCLIRHNSSSKSYKVYGEFVPNRGTANLGSNRRLDILRCPMVLTSLAKLQSYIHHGDHLKVQLMKGDVPIASFRISWKQRGAGYLLEVPANASSYNQWEGLRDHYPNGNNSKQHHIKTSVQPFKAHLCVPSMVNPIAKQNLALILEFISHHLNIGFHHISLSTVFPWSSRHNKQLVRLLRSYIEEGKLSIHTLSHIDTFSQEKSPAFEVFGLQFFKVFMTTLHSNLCLYMAKGVARYMMALESESFLVPHINLGKSTLQAMVDNNSLHVSEQAQIDLFSAKVEDEKWLGGEGWADKNKHPFCYLSISSQIVLPSSKLISTPWLGQRYSHNPEDPPRPAIKDEAAMMNALVPVDLIYYTSLDAPGACALPWYWNGCNDPQIEICLDSTGRLESLEEGLYFYHNFDDRVLGKDSRLVHEASVLKFHFYARNHIANVTKGVYNSYSSIWFQDVMRDLEERGLDLFFNLSPEPLADNRFLPSPKLQHIYNDSSAHSEFEVVDDIAEEEEREHLEDILKTSDEEVVTLPRFTADHSEFVLSGIIERSALSFELSVAVLLLSHHVVIPKANHNQFVILKVHPKAVSAWHEAITQFERTSYDSVGLRRSSYTWQCKIRNMVSDSKNRHEEAPYTVEAMFVPSKASVDQNANMRIDVLRCNMGNNMFNHVQYSGEVGLSVEVEIIKNNHPLIKFRIPWASRMAGYMAMSPEKLISSKPSSSVNADLHSIDSLYASTSSTGLMHSFEEQQPLHNTILTSLLYNNLSSLTINPWKGFTREHIGRWKMDRVYLCVPGWRSSASVFVIAHLLEFIEYHRQIGVQHIFLGATFAFQSDQMKLLIRALKVYMEEGFVSIASQSPDNIDFRFALGGISARHTPMKVIGVNVCLYFAKGMADYIAIWDVDEMFIPLGTNNNLIDFIDQQDTLDEIEVSTTVNRLDKGIADIHSHPLCYIQLYSTALYREHSIKYGNSRNLWLGSHFHPTAKTALAHKKAIHSTRKAFYVTLHTGGACKLPPQWTDCAEDGVEFCFKPFKSLAVRNKHNFNELVNEFDIKAANKSAEGMIYHPQYFRWHMTIDPVQAVEKNIYTERYSGKVLQALDAKGLYLPLRLVQDRSYYTEEEDHDPRGVEGGEGDEGFGVKDEKEGASSGINTLPLLSSDRSLIFLSSFTQHSSLILLMRVVSADFYSPSSSSALLLGLDTVKKTLTDLFSAEDKASNPLPNSVRCSIDMGTGREKEGIAGQYYSINEYLGFISCPLTSPNINNAQISLAYMIAQKEYSVDYVFSSLGAGYAFPPVSDSPSDSHIKALDPAEQVLLLSNRDIIKQGPAPTGGVHLCLPSGWTMRATRKKLSLLVEFIQHHLLLGVRRIYLPVHYPYHSKEMRYITYILRSYLLEHSVVMWSSVQRDLDLTTKGRYEINLSLCAFFAIQADYLLAWEINQFLLPDRPLDSANSLSTLLQGTNVQAVEMSVADYGENFLSGARQSPSLWQGEIYSRPPGRMLREAAGQIYSTRRSRAVAGNASHVLDKSYAGFDWQGSDLLSYFDQMKDLSHSNPNNTDSSNVDSGMKARLYEFFVVDEKHLHCHNDVQHHAETTTEHENHVYNRQTKSLCAWYDAADRTHLLHEDQSHGENLYHTHYFAKVYEALIHRGVDLFFGSILSAAPEQFESFKAGDEHYIPYFDVYAANPKRRVRDLNFTIN